MVAEATSTDDFRRKLTAPRMVELYDYWYGRKRGRAMPSRADLDPVDIPPMLGKIMLIDVLGNPPRFHHRLVGTHIVDATGEDRTGRFLDRVPFLRKHPVVLDQYRIVVETRQPLLSVEPITNCTNGKVHEVDRLLLPLSSDGQLVNMLLVYFNFRTGPFSASPADSGDCPPEED